MTKSSRDPAERRYVPFFYGMGYVREEIDRPLIGVVNAQNELIPGHLLLDRVAQAAKRGVLLAGGTPLEFPAIGICDGIAMGHEGMKFPLASRELICDFHRSDGQRSCLRRPRPHSQL